VVNNVRASSNVQESPGRRGHLFATLPAEPDQGIPTPNKYSITGFPLRATDLSAPAAVFLRRSGAARPAPARKTGSAGPL